MTATAYLPLKRISLSFLPDDHLVLEILGEHILEALADDGRIGDLAVHAPCRLGCAALGLYGLGLLFEVDPEHGLEYDEQGEYAQNSHRVGYCVGRSQPRCVGAGSSRIEEGLLRCTEARGVGHGA